MHDDCVVSAGSKYAQSGMFEVTKAEEEEKSSSPPPSPSPASNPPKQTSALRVNIPSDLQGVAYIEVCRQKGELNNCFLFNINAWLI